MALMRKFRSTERSLPVTWVSLAMLAVLVSTLTALFAIMTAMAGRLDRQMAARDMAQARGALARFQEAELRATTTTAKWDDLYDRLALTTDTDWADRNIGPYLFDQDKVRYTFVIDGRGVVTYASDGPRHTQMTPDALLGSRIRTLIDRAEAKGGPDGLGGWIRVGAQLGYLTFHRITRDDGVRSSTPSRYLLFVSLAGDGAFQRLLDNTALTGARVDLETSRDSSLGMPLLDPFGDPVGRLNWTVSTPGVDAMRSVLPFLVFIAMNAALLTLYLLYRMAHATRALHESEQRAQHLADHDWLTTIGNRRALAGRIAGDSQPGARALLCIDLDGFKMINDSHGHGTGDTVLTLVAERLAAFAGPTRFVARLGGDEFGVYLTDPADLAMIEPLGEALRAAIRAPMQIGELTVSVDASIGAACFDRPTTLQAMLHDADQAMYRVKAEHHAGRVVPFRGRGAGFTAA